MTANTIDGAESGTQCIRSSGVATQCSLLNAMASNAGQYNRVKVSDFYFARQITTATTGAREPTDDVRKTTSSGTAYYRAQHHGGMDPTHDGCGEGERASLSCSLLHP